MDKAKELKKIEEEVTALVKSPLYQYRIENNNVPVIGVGSPEARIMFVGEAPGAKEAKTGLAFVGAAGKVLDKLLASVGLLREDIYITSIVKDRPPENRDPTPDEIVIYAPFLDRQIEIIKPEVVVALGRFAMVYIMNRYGLAEEIAPIGALHGKLLQAEGFKFLPLYHPAAAIYNRKLLATLEEDFEVLKQWG
jgi:uracil-DNA glycosylase